VLSRFSALKLRLCALAVLIAALLAFGSTAASAAPTTPTMNVTELQQLIDDNGGQLDGYMNTVLKGSTRATIPVRILAVTGGFADGPAEMSALIVFEAYGPDIDKIGGIAAGMSGSPIYVDDGPVPTDTLVGALSYGDWFTLNGTGLATPIDAMSAIEDYMGTTSYGIRPLPEPMIIGGEVKSSVVIAPNPANLEAASEKGALVAKPLTMQYVGGVSPRSRIYQAYKKHLESHGASVVPLVGGLSSMESTFSAPMQGGSAIAALAARGDLWVGGVGTVTYVNGSNVLAFGHPMFYAGESSLYMTNAWIDGVWPSTNSPYKLARPAALAGTITQDRGAGIMGVEGAATVETTVTATVTNVDTGKVGTSTVGLPRQVINSASWDYQGLAPFATYIAASRVFDQYSVAGSAVTTTTVVVRDDDTDETFSIVKTNVFDDSYDIPGTAMSDVSSIVYQLQALSENGIAHPDILSVDLVAAITTQRNVGEIVDVSVDGGLRSGLNTATVSVFEHGIPETQSVDVTFTIPAGVPLTGDLEVSGPDGMGMESYFDEEMFFFDEFDSGPSTDRRTVSQAVADIRAELPNNVLQLTYSPIDVPSELDETIAGMKEYDAIEASKVADWVVSGYASKTAPRFKLMALDLDSEELLASITQPYGWPAWIEGELLGAENTSKIAVSRLYAGSSMPSALTTITYDPEEGVFDYMSPTLSRTAKLIFTFAGDADTLPTTGSILVRVRAKTTLTSSSYTFKRGKTVTLTAAVAPTSATGKVVFERYSGGWWWSIGTRNLAAGKAKLYYKPSSTGTYKIRARYVPGAGATNVTSTSSSRTLKVTR